MHTNASWNPPEDPTDGEWGPLAALAKLGDLDLNLTLWVGWVLTPVVIFFLLPMFMMMFVYASSLLIYIHRVHKRRLLARLREAAEDWDIAKAGREIVSALWDAQGWIWYGYEVIGIENIPEEGPALIVYYHGALPVDYYYLVAKVLLTRGRVIHSVVDSFLFKIPGLNALLNAFCCTPGTVSSCAKGLSDGRHLLGLSPGGVYEAQFSSHYYQIMWKNRLGFARIAIEAQVPIIPVFTQNVREAFRSVVFFKSWMKSFYEKTRLPIAPIFGGFPVKLRSFVGKPIPFDPEDTPESLRDKCLEAVQGLIDTHQRTPGSILRGCLERFSWKRHTS